MTNEAYTSNDHHTTSHGAAWLVGIVNETLCVVRKFNFSVLDLKKNKVCLRIAEICKLNFFTEIGNQNLQINFELNYIHFFFFCSRDLEVDKPIFY